MSRKSFLYLEGKLNKMKTLSRKRVVLAALIDHAQVTFLLGRLIANSRIDLADLERGLITLIIQAQ